MSLLARLVLLGCLLLAAPSPYVAGSPPAPPDCFGSNACYVEALDAWYLEDCIFSMCSNGTCTGGTVETSPGYYVTVCTCLDNETGEPTGSVSLCCGMHLEGPAGAQDPKARGLCGGQCPGAGSCRLRPVQGNPTCLEAVCMTILPH